MTDVRAIKVRPDHFVELPEQVATEEPMQIQVAGPGQDPDPLVVTMRTPGHDFELAAGFVVSEGVARRDEISSVAYCESLVIGEDDRFNTVTVRLAGRWRAAQRPRQFAASASCGVCGKSTIEDIAVACPVVGTAPPVAASTVLALPDALRRAQPVFDRTGGLHAAGLFDSEGCLLCAREDVGRHNAVDKVVGYTVFSRGEPDRLAAEVLMVSGRVSFEIVQKAAMAGIGTVAAVSAPSSLAVDTARTLGVALIGFVRGVTFNVYSHPERIVLDA
jgi:FdhD protein